MVMTEEELKLVIGFFNVLIFPVVGFLAGFFVKWFLQSRKSRDELLRALATNRAEAFQALWQRTVLPNEIRQMKSEEIVPQEFLRKKDADLLEWYYQCANALFLSWRSTERLFVVLDILRSPEPFKGHLEKALSSLRTALKRDSGMYTAWDDWRQLPTPRRASWPAATN